MSVTTLTIGSRVIVPSPVESARHPLTDLGIIESIDTENEGVCLVKLDSGWMGTYMMDTLRAQGDRTVTFTSQELIMLRNALEQVDALASDNANYNRKIVNDNCGDTQLMCDDCRTAQYEAQMAAERAIAHRVLARAVNKMI